MKKFSEYLSRKPNVQNSQVIFSAIKSLIEDMLTSDVVLEDMAADPVTFADDPEQKKHAPIANLPVMFDKYDIYYLYQFPPEFWSAALNYRYNEALYYLKTKEKETESDDIHDVTLSSGKSTFKFPKRNTFATRLADKLERQISMDEFEKGPLKGDALKQYHQNREKHFGSGQDKYGVMGTSLEDPKFADGKLHTRGYQGPNLNTNLTSWMKDITDHWLGDPEEMFGNEVKKVTKKTRGRGGDSEVYSFVGPRLKQIQSEMKAAGVPEEAIFEQVGNGVVTWTVYQDGKQVNYPKKPSGLPVLLPGKAVESSKKNEFEDSKKAMSSFLKNNDSMFQLIKKSDGELQNMMAESAKDAEVRADKAKTAADRNKVIKQAKEEMGVYKLALQFKKWLSDNNVSITSPEQLDNFKKEFEDHVVDNLRQTLVKPAKRHDQYDYISREFGPVPPEDADPLDTGMENPFAINKPPKTVQTVTNLVGGVYPNNQSKTQLVGKQGDWEKLSSKFGKGKATSTGQFLGSPFMSEEEVEEVKKDVGEYTRRIMQKVVQDKESMDFLGSVSHLESPAKLRKFLHNKLPVEVPSASGKSPISAEEAPSVPNVLRLFYNEFQDVTTNLPELEKAAKQVAPEEQGSWSEIYQGVYGAAKSGISRTAAQRQQSFEAAIKEYMPYLTVQCERYISRNVGTTTYQAYLKAQKSTDKYKRGTELKNLIRKASGMFTRSMMQLSFDEFESRRLRGKTISVSGGGQDSEEGQSMADIGESSALKNHAAQTAYSDDFEDEQFGKMQVYRKTRLASDMLSGAGHNIDRHYDNVAKRSQIMAEKAREEAEQTIKSQSGEALANGEIGDAEIKLAGDITAAMIVYEYFKQVFEIRNKVKGSKQRSAAEIAKLAQDGMTRYINMHGRAANKASQPEQQPQATVGSIPNAASLKKKFVSDVKSGNMDASQQTALQMIYNNILGATGDPFHDKDFLLDLGSHRPTNNVIQMVQGVKQRQDLPPNMKKAVNWIAVYYGLNQPFDQEDITASPQAARAASGVPITPANFNPSQSLKDKMSQRLQKLKDRVNPKQ